MALRNLDEEHSASRLFQAGESARRIGNHSLASKLFRRCLDIGRAEVDKPTIAWALWGLATLKRLSGEFDAAIDAYRRSADCAVEGENTDCLAWARAGHAEIIRHRRNHSAALSCHDRLLEVFCQNSDVVGQLWALQGIGQIHLVNDSAAADQYFRKAEDLALEIGDLRAIGFSRRALGMNARCKGDLPRAKRLLAEAGALFESLEYTVGMGFVSRELSHCEIVLGNLDQAEQLAREALKAFGNGFPLGRAWALATLADIQNQTGRPSHMTLVRSGQIFSALGVDVDLRTPQARHAQRLFLSGSIDVA